MTKLTTRIVTCVLWGLLSGVIGLLSIVVSETISLVPRGWTIMGVLVHMGGWPTWFLTQIFLIQFSLTAISLLSLCFILGAWRK